MYNKSWLLLIGLLLLIAPLGAAEGETDGNRVIFFLQRDIFSSANEMEYNRGFQELLLRLSPATDVEVYAFDKNNYVQLVAGKAGGLAWPPAGFEFQLPNPATTPYKNLLRFLQERQIHDQRVFFVSSGASQDMFQLMDTEGFLQGQLTFSPSKYAPLDQLKTYCRKNEVQLIGIYAREVRRVSTDTEDIALSAFLYVVNGSGGKAFYEFNSFPGIFEYLQKKGFLGP